MDIKQRKSNMGSVIDSRMYWGKKLKQKGKLETGKGWEGGALVRGQMEQFSLTHSLRISPFLLLELCPLVISPPS